jgi:8-oxo-dGTP pyrophosphatase MutT (NUDIX family)
MAQKYNIYINQKSLIVTSIPPLESSEYQLLDVQGFDFHKFYSELSENPNSVFYLISDHPKAILNQIKEKVKVIEAAGGLVKSEENKYLFIKRNGFWDLPKGKLEKDEKRKDAAVREVEEECGIKVKSLENKLLKTYHVYEMKGKVVLKVSHWYAMKSKSKQKLIPQTEEGITEVRWIAQKELEMVKANTYPSILEVLAFV